MRNNGKSRQRCVYTCCWLYIIVSGILINYVHATDISSYNENDEDYIPQKENVLEKSYHGLIRENETLVEITPLIKVDEEKICSFRILKKPYHEIPFEIEMFNNLGILKARHALNCEKRKNYHFELVAVFCDGLLSAPANIHINVVDVNEYAPIFSQASYETEVDEGFLYKDILRVEATDKDCTPLYGDVCKYEILNKQQPFVIDNEGSIRNTIPLYRKISHNHILNVVAYDCAMKQSAPVMVNIKVRSLCVPKINNIESHINYMPMDSKGLILFPNAQLELCDMQCDNQHMNIHASIVLETNHISFGCDRDTLNCSRFANGNTNDNSRKILKKIKTEPEDNFVNLLPKAAPWTQNLTYDEGLEPIFHFDGNTGVLVPETVMTQHDFASQPFSIITVFRHAPIKLTKSVNKEKHDVKHIKEHIICSADDHKMNRHHMALFVRNCRLILLLRKNFNEGDLNIFSPAEWRWKIPQVCDNQWHHYVLNVNVGEANAAKVELYIDGVLFEQAHEDRHNNPEIIDDWPLHAALGVQTKLSVGACYQSSQHRLKHAFAGDISVVKVSLNRILDTLEVKCLTDCAEYLVPPNEMYLAAENQLQINAQLNEIYIETQNAQNLAELLQEVRYLNKKQQPSLGRRNIEIRSTINCFNQSMLRLPTIHAYVVINETTNINTEKNRKASLTTTAPYLGIGGDMLVGLEDEDSALKDDDKYEQLEDGQDETNDVTHSKIVINGMANKLVSYGEIKQGVRILEDVNLTLTNIKIGEVGIEYLNTCHVIVFPSLNPDHEDISVYNDEMLSTNLNIKTNINREGVEMFGHDTITNYLSILRNLVYSNKKPAYYLNRVFKLNCRQLREDKHALKSGEYTLTLTVLHPKQNNFGSSTTAPFMGVATAENLLLNEADREDAVFSHAMVHTHEAEESQSKVHSIIHKADASHSTMLIALICLFVVILLCGVLVARMRSNNKNTHHQPCPKILDDSLAWDDSALTITINPMQSDVISEDSTDSENSDSDDEEVLKARFPNVNQLEWDNSNIFTSAIN